MAETKRDALAAFDACVEAWGVKYEKAVECLIKDREALVVFYDFPAEHWKSAHDERHRKRIRNGSSPHRAKQGMPVEQDRAGYDLQAG
jgi:transposase-like protein